MQLKQLDLPGGGLLTVYLRDCVETMPQAMERPLVLVVPGGGYSRTYPGRTCTCYYYIIIFCIHYLLVYGPEIVLTVIAPSESVIVTTLYLFPPSVTRTTICPSYPFTLAASSAVTRSSTPLGRSPCQKLVINMSHVGSVVSIEFSISVRG